MSSKFLLLSTSCLAIWCVNALADDLLQASNTAQRLAYLQSRKAELLSELQGLQTRLKTAKTSKSTSFDNGLTANFTSKSPDNNECYPEAPQFCEDPTFLPGCCCKADEICQSGGGCCDASFPKKCAKWISFEITFTTCCAEIGECCPGKTPKQSTCCDPTVSSCEVNFLGAAYCKYCDKDGEKMREACVDASPTKAAVSLISRLQGSLEGQGKVRRCIQCCMGRDMGSGTICDADDELDRVHAGNTGLPINDYSAHNNNPLLRAPVQGTCTKPKGVQNRWINTGHCVFTINGEDIYVDLTVGGCRVSAWRLNAFKSTEQVTAEFQLCYDVNQGPVYFPNFIDLRAL